MCVLGQLETDEQGNHNGHGAAGGRLLFNELSDTHPATFVDASNNLGGAKFNERYISGISNGDLDNDGFRDLVVVTEPITADVPLSEPDIGGWCLEALPVPQTVTQDGSPIVLKNNGNDNSWIGLKLIGTTSNRDGIGTRLSLMDGPHGFTQTAEVYAGLSYLSDNDHRVVFGLGTDNNAMVVIRWPSGCKETFNFNSVDQYVDVIEGTGVAQFGCN